MNPNTTLVATNKSFSCRFGKSWLIAGHLCAAAWLASVAGCDKLPIPGANPPAPSPPQATTPKPAPTPPVVVTNPTPPKVEPVAPKPPDGDAILDDYRQLQGTPNLMHDDILLEMAKLDAPHRDLVTDMKINGAAKVTVKGILTLHNFPKLRTLGADQLPIGRNAAALMEIAKLDNLMVLSLNRVGLVDDDLQYLKPLQNLKQLILDDNSSITDGGFVHLKHLRGLERLDVNGCSINGSGFRQFRDPKVKHPGLKVIVAHHTQFAAGGFEAIHKWNTIEEVHCSQAGTNDNNLFGLSALPNLRAISLGYDSFSIVGMTKAKFPAKKKLEMVSIENVPGVTDDCLALFKTNKSLKKMRLNRTKVSEAGIAQLKKILKTDIEITTD